MEKLIVVVMGENCEKFLPMCLESVKGADKLIYCSGSATGDINSTKIAIKYGAEIIANDYDQTDRTMNGRQRNFYLNYLKKDYPNDWALCLDADEVVDDLSKIKQAIQTAKKGLYCIKMRHFEGDLGHEDAVVPKHYVLNRLFKISEADKYPLVEHPVLQPNQGTEQEKLRQIWETDITTIWHLSYVPNMWEIKKKYENHLKKSNMHTPEYLKNWYYSHLFGTYPKSQVVLTDIPKVILNEFGIDKDEFYFINRVPDLNHAIMVEQWARYFKPLSVLDLGCGRGVHMVFWKWFVNEVKGIDLSKYAVQNACATDIINDNILNPKIYYKTDLITAIDVLEHLEYNELDIVLKNMKTNGNRFLFSIPFLGDQNLEADNTHKIKETKEWWIKKLSEYFDIKEAPKNWLYNYQLLIGNAKG